MVLGAPCGATTFRLLGPGFEWGLNLGSKF